MEEEEEIDNQQRESSAALQNSEFLKLLGRSIPRALGYGFIGFIALFLPPFLLSLPLFYLESSIRSPVSRAKADLRSVVTALEAYKVDSGVYPPGKPYFGPGLASTLTTPISYIGIYPQIDCFNPVSLTSRTLQYSAKIALRLAITLLVALLALMYAATQFLRPPYPNRLNRLMNAAWLGVICITLGISFIALFPAKPPRAFPVFERSPLAIPVYMGLMGFFIGFGHGLGKGLGEIVWHPLAIGKSALIVTVCTVSLLALDPIAAGLIDLTTKGRRGYDETQTYFLYATDGHKGWVIWSRGPDYEADLPAEKIPAWLQDLSPEEIEMQLQPYTYDPTNATVSPGDVWRMSE